MNRIAATAPFEAWHLDLRRAVDAAQVAGLSEAERARAARFVFERDRQRYLVAHWALRQTLALRLGIPAEALSFTEGPFGKPALAGTPACAFNLSHSEDVALIALADEGEIGVDVEMLRPMADALALARQNFSASEIAALERTPAERQSLAFLLGWTRKEACLKAIGSGLSIAPHIFTAGLGMAPCVTSIATPDGPRWVQVHSFMHGAEVVASLARVVSAPG